MTEETQAVVLNAVPLLIVGALYLVACASLLPGLWQEERRLRDPEVPLARLMAWVARWVEIGGASLNKPTHFEVADGRF